MEKNKYYTREKEINGKKYTAQFSGISTAIRAVDSSYIDGSSVTSTEKLGQYILDYVIVEPKGLTADDFESLDEYNEVTTWGRDVMYGKFRDGTDGGKAKAAGR